MVGLLSAVSVESSFLNFFTFAGNAFRDFSVNDAIDILLLSLLFTFAFRFFKTRKAGALLIGIGICLVVFIAATAFELRGIRFLLSGLFQIGALAFIIIFQPEIRDVLERVGTGSLRGFSSLGDKNHKKQMQYKVIDNVCKAAQMLSVEKTGALIVVECTTQLDDYFHTGTIIDAEVSDSLLRNIFYNRAPLHDGAVIINEGRIAAASCILPLPKRTFVDAELGTRHRAAIGLSEISDAIIIVVSEETGTISVARETTLIRNFTADSLRKYLLKELIRETESGKEKR